MVQVVLPLLHLSFPQPENCLPLGGVTVMVMVDIPSSAPEAKTYGAHATHCPAPLSVHVVGPSPFVALTDPPLVVM